MSEGSPGACLIFRIGPNRCVLPVTAVIEVLRQVPLTRVPAGARAVRGLVNHRGRVLTVADLGQIMGVPGNGEELAEVIVVEQGDRRFALAVDAVLELASETRTGLAMIDLDQVANAIFA